MRTTPEGPSLFADEEGVVVFTLDEIEEGDFVAYPGMVSSRGVPRHVPSRLERDPRDWLEVRRIADGHVIGVRVNALEWEIELEYHVYPQQLADNGVELVHLRRDDE